MKTSYKVKKFKDGFYHVYNSLKWTAMMCDKKRTANVVRNIFNATDFDNITDAKLAKQVHDFASMMAEAMDKGTI